MPVYLTDHQCQAKKALRMSLPEHQLKAVESLPASFSLRDKCPTGLPYQQYSIGSCTANAISAAIRILDPSQDPSRLYIYFTELRKETPTGELTDTGANPMDGCLALEQKGVCEEKFWPYDISKFNVTPPATADANAALHKIHQVRLISRGNDADSYLTALQTVLASGLPILTGIAVYSSFESEAVAKTGTVPMPDVNKEQFLGWHEVTMISYDKNQKLFGFMNSWGEKWGDQGFFTLPFEYVTKQNLVYQTIVITKN